MLGRPGGPPLPEPARNDLAAFEAERARAEESRREVGPGDLLALNDDDLLQRLRSDRSFACEAAWSAAVGREPRRALRLFSRLVADDAIPARAALEVAWRVRGPTSEENLDSEAFRVFADLPTGSLERHPDVASALARFVAAVAERDGGDRGTGAQLLALWDRLIGPIAAATSPRRGDAAGILPIDDLIHTLLLYLERAREANDAERRQEIRSRLDRVATDRTAFGAALWEFGRWLPFMNDLEPSWTEAHLLPAFDWAADPARAGRAWEGYLSGSAVMPATLWPKMCLPFVAAFQPDHLNGLSPHAREKLVQVLVGVVLFGVDRSWRDDDARRALRACDQSMLRSAASLMWRVVEDEDQPERRDALWRSRLGHLLQDLWPKEVEKQDRTVWTWLLRMAVALDETFTEAVAAITALPSPPTIENAGIFDELGKSLHPNRPEHANAVRRLLSLLIERLRGHDDEPLTDIEARLAAVGEPLGAR